MRGWVCGSGIWFTHPLTNSWIVVAVAGSPGVLVVGERTTDRDEEDCAHAVHVVMHGRRSGNPVSPHTERGMRENDSVTVGMWVDSIEQGCAMTCSCLLE